MRRFALIALLLCVAALSARAQFEGIRYIHLKQSQLQNGSRELYAPNNNASVDSSWAYLNAHYTIADTPIYYAQLINGRTQASLSTNSVTTIKTFTASVDSQWIYGVAGGIPSTHADSGLVLTSLGDVFAPVWLPAGGGAVDSVRASHIADTAKVTHYADSTGKIPATAVTPGSYTNTNLTVNQSGQITAASNGSTSSGTVTSFSSGDFPVLFTASVATSTTTPALSFTAVAQSPNLVYAGPTSGGAVAAAFRSLVAADLPSTAVTPGSYTLTNITVDAQGRITAASNGSALTNPMTTLGDIIYSSNGSGTPARLARGDTTMFLGIRSVTNIPAWTDTLFRNGILYSNTSTTPGLILANTTPSTSVFTQRVSPSFYFEGHGWNPTATAADSTIDAYFELDPQADAPTTAAFAVYIGNSKRGYPSTIFSNREPVMWVTGAAASGGVSPYYWGYNGAFASRGDGVGSIVNTVVNSCIIGGGSGGTTDGNSNSISGTGNGFGIYSGMNNHITGNGNYTNGVSAMLGGYGNTIDGLFDVILGGGKSGAYGLCYNDGANSAIICGLNDTILSGGGLGMIALGGEDLSPNANGQVVIGQFNVKDATHAGAFALTDTAFVIGNGTNASPNRHDALTINKLGDIGMQGHIITRDTVGAATDDATGITSASVVGSDVAGTITVTSTLAAGGGWVQVAFGRVYGTVPTVVISPSNANANALSIADGAYVTATAAAFKINWSATIAETGATYNYIVIAPK